MVGIPAPDVADYKRRKEIELGLSAGSISQPPPKRAKIENRPLSESELKAQLEAHKALMGNSQGAESSAAASTSDASTGAVYGAGPQAYASPPPPMSGGPPPPGFFGPPPPGFPSGGPPPFPPPFMAGFPPGYVLLSFSYSLIDTLLPNLARLPQDSQCHPVSPQAAPPRPSPQLVLSRRSRRPPSSQVRARLHPSPLYRLACYLHHSSYLPNSSRHRLRPLSHLLPLPLVGHLLLLLVGHFLLLVHLPLPKAMVQ